MKYDVDWLPSALQELADLWNQAVDKTAVTQAADIIDSVLARNPLKEGEGREDGLRILVVPPLAVYYDAEDNTRSVTILAVWRWQ